MSIKTLTKDQLTWVNIDQVDQAGLTYLKEHYNFHALDFADLQSEQQTPKIDVYKNYLFIILQFPHWQAPTLTIVPHEIDIFIGDNYLITIQYSKSKELKDLFYRCLNNHKVKAEWMGGSSGYLLYCLIEAMFKNSHPILNNMGKQINRVEEKIFQGEPNTSVVKELAVHRRNLLNFRRIIDPDRYLVSTLSHTRQTFLDQSLSLYFDDVSDYLQKLWVIAQSYKDTIDGLHVTVESLLARRTNKVISALTMISVSLLPLSVLASIYGMNIANLPYAQNPRWVWLMFSALTVLILIAIGVMKKKKWL